MGYDEQLQEYRKQIDEVDAQLLPLLQRRMEIVKAVGHLKHAHGAPALDSSRERQIIARLSGMVDEEYRPYAEMVVQAILDVSKKQQHALFAGQTADAEGDL